MPQATLPGLSDHRTVRTPKCGALFASQIWEPRGHWLVGLYPTKLAARSAAHAFDPDAPAPGAVWHKRRCRAHTSLHGYVRKVKGQNTWQARCWLGPQLGSLNLGLFSSADHGDKAEWAAGQVSAAFDREWQGARTVGEVVAALKVARLTRERVPDHVDVPPHQRDAVRPAPKPTCTKRHALAERLAAQLRDNLFGEPVTADGLLAHWDALEERRDQYRADFMQGLEEGETVEDLVDLLADG